MRLCHCFMELIAYISYLKREFANKDLSIEKVRQEIEGLIEKNQTLCKEHGFSREEFEFAQFAVLAWIDETMMQSTWSGKQKWRKNLLQKQYYKTSAGGTKFYERLNQLEPEQNEVREVYCLCLLCGFRGKYGDSEEDQRAREHIIAKNIKRLTGTADSLSSETNQVLFRGSYPDANLNTANSKPKRFEMTFSSALITFGPLILIGSLFMLYRYILNSA